MIDNIRWKTCQWVTYIVSRQAYKEGKKEKPFILSEEAEESLKTVIPEDLTCTLCHDLMIDVVMMPCCGTSFCDECKYRFKKDLKLSIEIYVLF